MVHIGEEKDFTPVIEKALKLGGFPAEQQFTGINGGTSVTTGFGHHTVLSVADTIIDAYSAVKAALALADAFDCEVNDLPLTLVLSWYEQKAVCILLALLHLGMKNIYLGPTLPAFLSDDRNYFSKHEWRP